MMHGAFRRLSAKSRPLWMTKHSPSASELITPKPSWMFSTHTKSAASSELTSTEFALDSHPPLVHIPSLPIVGSTIPWHSGAPAIDFTRQRENLLERKEKFGHFYTMGFPGYGVGIHGTCYVLSDPREYMKVVRHEGVHPSGLIESLWPLKEAAVAEKDVMIPFFGRGPEWKRIRAFMQTDLLSPQSAAAYIPGVIRAAEMATNTENVTQENLDFVQAAVTCISFDAQLLLSPKEAILNQIFRVKTPKFKALQEASKVSKTIATDKVEAFIEKYEAGELDDLQQKSYLANAVKRFKDQQQDGDNNTISNELLVGICQSLLTASVDTTSGVLSWALVHMAFNPDVQEKIYQELKSNISDSNGRLTPDVINKRDKAPYLYASLRESHRLTPALHLSISKQVSKEIEIHGEPIPPDQKFLFDNYSLQMDPAYVEDPEAFRPERWFPDQVMAREGTSQELIDHPFFKDSFSQGARKCPGSRVASNEILCFLAQLLLDYQISIPGYHSYKEITYDLQGTSAPIFPRVEFLPRN